MSKDCLRPLLRRAQRGELSLGEQCELIESLLSTDRVEDALRVPALHPAVLCVAGNSDPAGLICAARKALDDVPYDVRCGILGILARLGQRERDRGPSSRLRLKMVRASMRFTSIGRTGPELALHNAALELLADTPPDITEKLRSECAETRAHGVLLASISPDAGYVTSLLEHFSDSGVQSTTAMALLSASPDADRAARQLRAARDGARPQTCSVDLLIAIEYARRSGGSKVLPLLVELATHPDHSVSQAAQRVLLCWKRKSKRVKDLGEQMFTSPYAATRTTGLLLAIRHSTLNAVLELLRSAIFDPSRVVRTTALRAARHRAVPEDTRLELATIAIRDRSLGVQRMGLALLLGVSDSGKARSVLDRALDSNASSVRLLATRLVFANSHLQTQWRLDRLEARTADTSQTIVAEAVSGLLGLGIQGRAAGLRLLKRLRTPVQASMLRSLPKSQARAHLAAVLMFLRSPDPDVVSVAFEHAIAAMGKRACAEYAMRRIHLARGVGATQLLKDCERVGCCDILQRPDWLLRHAKSGPLRAEIAERVINHDPAGVDSAWVIERLRDPEPHVRLCVARALPGLCVEHRRIVLEGLLRDQSLAVAKCALDQLTQEDTEACGDAIAELLTRSGSESEIAPKVLRLLEARLPERRAVAAFLSCAVSGDMRVAKMARAGLRRFDREAPALWRPRDWRATTKRIRDLFLWGEDFGRRVLGRPVQITSLQSGLGMTVSDESRTMRIWVNPIGLTMGERHGEDLIRGLIAHEIGHHVYDIHQPGQARCRKASRRLGVGHIFDLLIDERLERHMRTLEQDCGVPLGQCFDRLAAYAFARSEQLIPLRHYSDALGSNQQAVRREFASARRRGRIVIGKGIEEHVAIPAVDALCVPGAFDDLSRFHFCFRGGHDPNRFGSPAVRTAMGRLPSDLRQLSHDQILELAHTIARDLDVPRDIAGQDRKIRDPDVLSGTLLSPNRIRDSTETKKARGPSRSVEISRAGDRSSTRATPIRVKAADYIAGREGRLDLIEVRDRRGTLPRTDEADHLRARVRPHTAALGWHFERIGMRERDRPGSRNGVRVDPVAARRAALMPVANALIGRRFERDADLALALLIDRSSSMRGERIELAKTIAMLLAESASRVPGVEGHVATFTDQTYEIIADLGRKRGFAEIVGLTAEGGNNDAAAVARAVGFLKQSRRTRKVLCMLSDGMPAECSVAQLREQVAVAERRHGIRCVQIAMAPIVEVGFQEFVDVSTCEFEEAIPRITGILASLAEGRPVKPDRPVSREEYLRKAFLARRAVAQATSDDVPF